MRKKTATQTPKHQRASSTPQTGLLARAKTATQSAVTPSPLDNHSHRTDRAYAAGDWPVSAARSGRSPVPVRARPNRLH